jgi:hypothetical protein
MGVLKRLRLIESAVKLTGETSVRDILKVFDGTRSNRAKNGIGLNYRKQLNCNLIIIHEFMFKISNQQKISKDLSELNLYNQSL